MTSEEKYRARSLVAQAVRKGTLVKPQACSRCNFTGPIQGHHEDYAKPLDVEWLCDGCHRERHGAIGREVGRAILLRFEEDMDAQLEKIRKEHGLTRAAFVRTILTERLNADARMSA